MALDIPLPTASPQDDPEQYTPLLLSAIEGFLLARDVWEEADYNQAYSYMQELMEYITIVMDGNMVTVPVGTIAMYAADTPPDRWLKCTGVEISRDTYGALFSVIGTMYGVGDGTTTFNLPNFIDRSPMGSDGDLNPGDTAGALTATLTTAQIPAHNHAITDPGHNHAPLGAAVFQTSNSGGSTAFEVDIAGQTRVQGATTATNTTGISANNTGGGEAHPNLHPVIGIMIIIYVGETE